MDNLVSPSTSSGNYPWQTTISKQKSFNGIGLHSGNLINVTFKPAKENTGIIFIRTDIDKKIKERSIKALYSNVSDTSLCTTIENEYGIQLSGDDIADMQSVQEIQRILKKKNVF